MDDGSCSDAAQPNSESMIFWKCSPSRAGKGLCFFAFLRR